MTPEDAERVLELFSEACACPPEQRADFLTRVCAGNAVVRAEVESLLSDQAPSPDFLAQPAFERGMEVLSNVEANGELTVGDILGDYRVISLLGVGGMGEVYLADDLTLGRQVALKLIQRGRSGTLLRHFHHERRVLAGLTHPNIARLYGAAVTPEGRAYLVMEYVEGERLDRYCDDHRLGIPERLVLFRKVCAAVSYAHQNLVVHRDLKPANIRVTPEGEPKLLDFGIAKLLDTETTSGRVEVTATLSGAMTPEYASPEQLRGETITTASDVYSLGVVLYELLCGERPHQLKSRRPDELARAICEEEPARPSTVAGRGPTTSPTGLTTATTPATQDGEPPAKVRRRLEGDLDNIAAMALRKEPSRRYASVAQLSNDIHRHCEGLPVSARKDTLGYRAGKFVRRNKVSVGAAAVVVLALLAGLLTTVWQARVARQERDRARVALASSELAKKQSEQLNAFLQTLLASANPEDGPGRDLRVVQVLDQASARLDQDLAGEPALLAQAHLTIGQAYAGLREDDPALNHLRAALEIDRRIYGDGSIVTARVKAVLGGALVDLPRRYSEAEPLLREALAVERRQPPGEQRELPVILKYEGRILGIAGRIDEARAMVAESLALDRKKDAGQDMTYAGGLQQLADLAFAQGDYAAAEAPLRQAVAIQRRLRPHAPSFARLLTKLGYDLILQAKLDEPEGILQEAQELYRSTVGENNTAYGMNIGCLSWLHLLRGEYAKAEAEMRVAQVIALASQVPTGEQDYVGGRVALALAVLRQGRAVEAEPELRACLELAKTNHLAGNASPEVVAGVLGECLQAQNRYAEAEPLLLADYDHLRTSSDNKIPKLTDPTRQLHKLYTDWNKPAQAARFDGDRTVISTPTPLR